MGDVGLPSLGRITAVYSSPRFYSKGIKANSPGKNWGGTKLMAFNSHDEIAALIGIEHWFRMRNPVRPHCRICV